MMNDLTLKPLLNRANSGQKIEWIHLVAPGEVPITAEMEDGTKADFVQVYDASGIDAILNRFQAEKAAAGDDWSGLLVDYDHFSCDTDTSSEAAGWIVDLENREDGLWGKVDWSDSGLAAVQGKRFKFASAVHRGGDFEVVAHNRVRPTRINRAALTNDPNNRRLKPIRFPVTLLNRATASADPDNNNRPADAGSDKGEAIMEYKMMLLEFLDLPPEATDEQIAEAKKNWKSKSDISEMENKLSEAMEEKTELMNLVQDLTKDLVEHDLTAHESVIDPEQRDEVKAALLANRAGTLKVLKGIKKPAKDEGQHQFLNRRDASAPSKDAVRREKEKDAFVSEVKDSYGFRNRADAVGKAIELRPDLFQDAQPAQ